MTTQQQQQQSQRLRTEPLAVSIAFEWALRKFGYLGESVQGWGFQPRFSVSEVSKEEYEKCPPTEWGGSNLKSDKIFLSPMPVEGFPENIDYMKQWIFK